MRTLNRIHDFDALAERLWGTTTPAAAPSGPRPLAIDVYETADAFVVSAAVPGVAPEAIGVEVDQNVLTIRAERAATTPEGAKVYRRENGYGSFSRSLRLSERLNAEAISAEYANGVLTLTIPRTPEAGPKMIAVHVATPTAPAAPTVIAGETTESAS